MRVFCIHLLLSAFIISGQSDHQPCVIDSGCIRKRPPNSSEGILSLPSVGDNQHAENAMDLQDLNYLTLLKSGVCKHLFKFLSSGSISRIQEAYNLSHEHQEGGPCSGPCEDFQKCVLPEIVWECVELETRFPLEEDDFLIAVLEDEERQDLQMFKEHIKHLQVITDCYLLEASSYHFLKEHLVSDNATLESLTMQVREDIGSDVYDFHPPINGDMYHDRPSWSLLMMEMTTRSSVTVTLEIHLKDSSYFECQRCCEVFSLPENDPFCQNLTDLRLGHPLPGDKTLSNTFPFLTEIPSVVFMAKLPVLQHLQIGVYNLSSSLLSMFANRARNKVGQPLRTMTIFIHLLHEQSEGPLPELSDTDWHSLVQACPALRVHCYVIGTGLEKVFHEEEFASLARKTEAAELRYNAVDKPVQNGLGPSDSKFFPVVESGFFPNDHWRSLSVDVSNPLGTAGNALLSVLKRSAPLDRLKVEMVTVKELNDVISKCRSFRKTLRLFTCRRLIGNPNDVNFQDLITGDFFMHTIQRTPSPAELPRYGVGNIQVDVW